MKKMKKIMAIVLVAIMMMAMSVTAMAATINMQGVLKDETYTAYQLLHYTTDGSSAYSYYLTHNEYTTHTELVRLLQKAGLNFTQSSDKTRWYVNNSAAANADKIIAELNNDTAKTALENDTTGALSTTSATATANGTISINTLEVGYYFIDSTTGSLCELKSYDAQEVIFEKNAVPSVDKKQGLTSGSYADDLVDANIGDTVYYQITVTDGTGTDAAITVTDTLSAGLTYTAGSLKIDGTAVADNEDSGNYTVSVSGQEIKIILKEDYVASLRKDDTVVITYAATINSGAVIDSATGNSNTAELSYSKQTSTDRTYVATYDFVVNKVNGTSEALTGAQFKLYTAETGGDEITFSKDDTGYYVSSTGTEVITAGTNINVRGLKPGTYWLEETVAPAGYNLLSARVAVHITTGATEAVVLDVENNAGSILPSTGGIGTTIFYVIGAILVIGAGVVLVTRRRMGSNS